jgi:DNA replication protein DnaC
LPVPLGHADFGRLIRCACGMASDAARQSSERRARLQDELGALHDKTFATFDLARPLTPIYQLDGRYYRDLARIPFERRSEARVMSVAVQENALHLAYADCQDYARLPSSWLCLHGAVGAGKSHLAAAIAWALVGAEWSVRYRSVPGMLDAIKAGFKDNSADEVFDDLLSADLLILDDLGAQNLSGWGYERLFRLFNERTNRPTIITMNAHPDDLADGNDLEAMRLTDRIAQAARKVWLPISSYRRIGREAAQ